MKKQVKKTKSDKGEGTTNIARTILNNLNIFGKFKLVQCKLQI